MSGLSEPSIKRWQPESQNVPGADQGSDHTDEHVWTSEAQSKFGSLPACSLLLSQAPFDRLRLSRGLLSPSLALQIKLVRV